MGSRPVLENGGLGHKRPRGVNAPAVQKVGDKPSARQRYPAIGQPRDAMLDHGVAAAMLGGIEGGVGVLDQVARLLRLIWLGTGHADADGDGLIVRGARGIARFRTAARTISPISRARFESVLGTSRQNSSPP